MTLRRFSSQFTVFAAGALLLVAVPLRAQAPMRAADAASDTTASAPTTPVAEGVAGPTMASAAVGVHRVSGEPAPTPFSPRGGYGQSTAMMVVGGAAVIAGLVIGGGAGYAISVGGAVVGLIGLYQYLQ